MKTPSAILKQGSVVTYRVAEQATPKTGKIIDVYAVGKYLVEEDQPAYGQPKSRFVFQPQIVK